MNRTFRYPLHPTVVQAATLNAWLWKTRDLYNMALQERRDAWRCGAPRSLYDQQKELPRLRAEDSSFAAVSSRVLRGALCVLDRAFKAFFRRCKAGEKPGYPRFRGRDRWRTLDFRDRFEVRGSRIYLEKIGEVKLNLYRPLKGEALCAWVTKTARGWFVSVSCKLPDVPKVAVKTACGIDLNLKDLVVTSTGAAYANPREGKKAAQRLADLQRALARKRRGSNGRRKVKARLARAHERVRESRLNNQRQLAATLFGKYDLIAHEDLDIREMVSKEKKGLNLRKSIHDAAWGGLIRCLQVKAENAGRWLVPVDPRGTSKTCSTCGAIRKTLTLYEREWTCAGCGVHHDRDVNAAVNIYDRGMRSVPELLERSASCA